MELKNIMPIVADYEGIDPWTAENLQKSIGEIIKAHNSKAKEYYPVLNEVIMGKPSGPNISKVMEIMGKTECLKRIGQHHLMQVMLAFDGPCEDEE